VPGAGKNIPYPTPTGTHVPEGTTVEALVRKLNFEDRRDSSLLAGESTFVRGYVYEAFNRDSVVAATLRSSLNVTPLFSAMVARHGIRPEHSGADALAITVPNVGALPWEAVVEFRDHPGSQEARAKLREFDARGADGDPERGYEYLRSVHGAVTTALFEALDDQRRGLPEQLAEEAIKTAVSFVPVVGPAVELTASVADAVIDTRRFNRSWIAALMQLRARS
jgi:hypothetical protein